MKRFCLIFLMTVAIMVLPGCNVVSEEVYTESEGTPVMEE